MKLNYKMYGQGHPIIIMHGMFGMLDNWQKIAKILSANFWVITLDLRNHGRSPHSEDFNYQLMVDDLYSFLQTNQINKPHIIGHSMGGKVAMHFALEYPDMLNKLIVIDIGIKKYKPRHTEILDILNSIILSNFDSRSSINTYFENKIQNWDIRQFLLKNIARNKNKYTWKMNLKSITKNYHLILEEIICDNPYDNQSLFIIGEKSNYITEEDKFGISKLFNNTNFITIENAGHWLHAEKPQELTKQIFKFINN